MMDEQSLFWIAAVIQTFGIVTLVLSRTGDVLVPARLAACLFYAAMILVGCCSAASLAIEGHGWLMSGVTLGLMAVGGTIDFKHSADAEVAAF